MKRNHRGIARILCSLAVLAFGTQASWGQVELGNSETEFSGVQGQDDWTYGYRNYTDDGGAQDYDPVADFIPFADGEFDGTNWDLVFPPAGGAPWTLVGATQVHPANERPADGLGEHWAIRRWTATAADVPAPTLVAVEWFVAAQNLNGSGTTGQLHLNGVEKAVRSIAGNDGTGVTTTTFMTIEDGDVIDLALTPVGPGGDRGDGADGSFTRMTITTVVDTDSDGLADAWEEVYFPGDLTQLSSGGNLDGDELTDLEEFEGGSNPTSADIDEDGYTDAEELAAGTDPNRFESFPLTDSLADSRTQFSGVDGQDGWRWGYRDYTADGKGTNYDAETDFIPFPVDGTTVRSSANFWNGNAYDWANDAGNVNPPWTAIGQETTHPNGTNNTDEHWTVRRWTASGLGSTTPVRVIWHTRKGNTANDGITGSVHLNGTEADSVTLAGSDTVGFFRVHYFNLNDGDIVDLVLTPEGLTNRTDGSDGSANWMTIDTRVPDVPIQSDGKYFIPVGSEDSDTDGLADFWEKEYFPDDLTQLASGNDFDSDGLMDEEEQDLGTNPNNADSDGDGLTDGQEVALGTDPCDLDSDGDGFGDAHEAATGYDPADPASNVTSSAQLSASLLEDYPTGAPDPQGVNGWTYGYYNVTLNGAPTDQSTFIPFPTDGTSIYSPTNFWDGNNFDMIDGAGAATNPPWTNITATTAHPNGDNNVEVHWTTARWTADADGPVALSYELRKQGLGGNGTTAIVLQNGMPLDEITVGGTDAVGLRSWYFVDARAGDTLEIALSPKGVDETDNDGSDNSHIQLWVDSFIPANPVQPDGTPFVPGSGVDALRVLSVDYDEDSSLLKVSFTSRDGFEYQVEQLSGTDPVTWTPIGPSASPQPGGVTEVTIPGVTDPRAIIHVIELVP